MGVAGHRIRRSRRHTGPVRTVAGAVVIALVVSGAVLALGIGRAPDRLPAQVPVAARPGPATIPVADPVEVRIPRIGVVSTLVRLGVDGLGVLQPPATADVAGWYAGGVAPGDPGPAVIAGHVDSRAGPGVFFDLRDMGPGDRIEVVDATGRSRAFTVQFLEQTGKERFPTEQVYGPTPVPELRLITCGGEFQEQARSYRDNIIVHATFG